MKYFSFLIILITFAFNGLFAQNTLFDDSRVSSVFIEISPDSLNVIMQDVLSDHYFKAKFIYDYGTGSDTLQDVGFRLRGNTSRYSHKKSFKISFNEYVPGREYQSAKKINLNGEHNDPTMVREKLFYDTWANSGMPERKTSFVKVYINNTYYGLYTNLEEIDKNWLQRVYGDNDGNLYKCTYPADLVYLGANQQYYKNIVSGATTGGRAYDLQTNESTDDYTDLVDLITTLNRAADTTFARLISEKFNVDGFLKAFALDVASGNWDDYMYNKNNYYLYHRTDNNKFEFVSYDTDNTFGIDWVGQDWATRNCLKWYEKNQPRPLATKILAIPAYYQKYKMYLDTMARYIVNPNVIFHHIDSLELLITDAAVADSFRRLDYGYTVADFHGGFIQTIDGHSPYGIKPFLTKRVTTILQQIGTASVTDYEIHTNPFAIFPDPADEMITIRCSSVKIDQEGAIFDLQGRKLKKFAIPRNQAETVLNVEDLKPGVYLVVLTGNHTTTVNRFIKR